jgi:hypothetical protein
VTTRFLEVEDIFVTIFLGRHINEHEDMKTNRQTDSRTDVSTVNVARVKGSCDCFRLLMN